MPLPAYTESEDPLALDVVDFSEEALQAQQLLLAAAHHDTENLRILLRSGATISSRDEDTGWTALHSAIGSLSPEQVTDDAEDNPDGDSNVAGHVPPADIAKAEKTVKWLLDNGASWSDIDANDETPGCLALRLGFDSLYGMMVDAGVRAELLVGGLDGYERLADEEADEELSSIRWGHTELREAVDEIASSQSTQDNEVARHLDILAWENIIKHRTTDALISQTLPSSNATAPEHTAAQGPSTSADEDRVYRILSITKPGDDINGAFTHFLTTQYPQPTTWELHIVYEISNSTASSSYAGNHTSQTNTASSSPNGKIITHDTLSSLELSHPNTLFDAIYLDPTSTSGARTSGTSTAMTNTQEISPAHRRNAELYTTLHTVLSTYLPSLLSETGRFSFFHTLGSQRQVSYDVYTKVIEIDCLDSGLEVDWTSVSISAGLAETIERQKRERREWCVKEYRMPVIRFE